MSPNVQAEECVVRILIDYAMYQEDEVTLALEAFQGLIMVTRTLGSTLLLLIPLRTMFRIPFLKAQLPRFPGYAEMTSKTS